MRKASLILISIGLIQYPSSGQAGNALGKYQIVQYASVSRYGPQNIMRFDNNGDILLACREGLHEDDLKGRGVSFSQSQLALLETYRLVARSSDTLRTLIPLLDSVQTSELRQRSAQIAEMVCESTEGPVRALKEHLEQIKRERNAYSIIFSYVVDGLVWRRLEELGVVRKREIGGETPLWAGEVWGLYRPRDFNCGTNRISDQGISMNVNWSQATIPKMMPFVADFKNLIQMFNDYIAFGRVKDPAAKEVFAPFDLFDRNGLLTIPVIREYQSDSLYNRCIVLSEQIVQLVLKSLDTQSMRKRFDFKDESQTAVVVYHEIMWDLMDAYEMKGCLKKPVAFSIPDQAESSDIADLVFIVRGGMD